MSTSAYLESEEEAFVIVTLGNFVTSWKSRGKKSKHSCSFAEEVSRLILASQYFHTCPTSSLQCNNKPYTSTPPQPMTTYISASHCEKKFPTRNKPHSLNSDQPNSPIPSQPRNPLPIHMRGLVISTGFSISTQKNDLERLIVPRTDRTRPQVQTFRERTVPVWSK